MGPASGKLFSRGNQGNTYLSPNMYDRLTLKCKKLGCFPQISLRPILGQIWDYSNSSERQILNLSQSDFLIIT